MVYSSLCKTIDGNGLLAHIYEHLIAQYVLKHLQSKGFFAFNDIILTAKTYGDTCLMDAQLYNPAALETYDEALQLFDGEKISESDALRAANECGIEMEREVRDIRVDELLYDLKAVQHSKWHHQSDLTYRQAHDESSVNTLFSVPYLKYSKKSKNSFSEYVLEYSVDESHIASPTDQALAAMLMQSVALNFLVIIRENYTVYDRGDQWSEASISVGYRMFLGVTEKDERIIEQLKHEFVEYKKWLLESPFCNSLKEALIRCSHNHDQMLFDRDALNTILGGCIIGGKGWLSMADDEKIKRLLMSIELDVYSV